MPAVDAPHREAPALEPLHQVVEGVLELGEEERPASGWSKNPSCWSRAFSARAWPRRRLLDGFGLLRELLQAPQFLPGPARRFRASEIASRSRSRRSRSRHPFPPVRPDREARAGFLGEVLGLLRPSPSRLARFSSE